MPTSLVRTKVGNRPITTDYSLSRTGLVAIPWMVFLQQADNVEQVWHHCSDQRHDDGDLVLTVPRHYDFFVSRSLNYQDY